MLNNKRFYIKSDAGYYKDFILSKFVQEKEEAHIFMNKYDAAAVKKALRDIDKITGLEIIEESLDMGELINLAKKVVEEAEANAVENPRTEEIQIVVVEPQKKPYKTMIKNDLEPMNDIVGGWIENLMIGQTKRGTQVGVVLNEEGKLRKLPMNRRVIGFDFIVGTFFITAYNLQGDNISLTDEEAAFYIKKFTPIEVYI